MSKSVFISIVMIFILIVGGIPFYWFAYRPSKIRKDCLSVSLSAAFESSKGAQNAKQKAASYFRKHAKIEDDFDPTTREARDEALYLLARQKEGYGICLAMRGLKEQ